MVSEEEVLSERMVAGRHWEGDARRAAGHRSRYRQLCQVSTSIRRYYLCTSHWPRKFAECSERNGNQKKRELLSGVPWLEKKAAFSCWSILIRATRKENRHVSTSDSTSYKYCYTSLFVFYPISYLRPSFYSLSLLVVTQIRGHIAGSSPPSPLRFVPRIFIAKIFQLFLPSSTRVELCLPTLRALSN